MKTQMQVRRVHFLKHTQNYEEYDTARLALIAAESVSCGGNTDICLVHY